MQTYPMVQALVKHGSLMAGVIGFATVTLGVYIALNNASIIYALIGTVLGAVVFGLLKSYSELISIIADMMLPK
jgi:hypothetical protein